MLVGRFLTAALAMFIFMMWMRMEISGTCVQQSCRSLGHQQELGSFSLTAQATLTVLKQSLLDMKVGLFFFCSLTGVTYLCHLQLLVATAWRSAQTGPLVDTLTGGCLVGKTDKDFLIET